MSNVLISLHYSTDIIAAENKWIENGEICEWKGQKFEVNVRAAPLNRHQATKPPLKIKVALGIEGLSTLWILLWIKLVIRIKVTFNCLLH